MEITNLPRQRIDAEFAASEANRDERTVPMTFYSGAEVLQFTWDKGAHRLQLSMDDGAADLRTLATGRAPFTRGHADANDPNAVLGVISNPRREGNKYKADVRFSKRADVEPVYQDVLDGILRNVSMGVALRKMKETTREGDKMRSFTALKWEPFNVALVAEGADPNASFSAAPESECEIEFTAERAASPEETQMEKPIETNVDEVRLAAQTAERNRVLEINKIAKAGKIDAAFAAQHVESGTSVEDFRKLAFDQLAARSEENPTQSHAAITRDQEDTRRAGFSEAIRSRAGLISLTDKDPGYQYRGLASQGMIALAAEYVRLAGKDPSRMSPTQIAELAMSTSDFPYVLASTADASLRAGYALAPQNWRQIFSRRTAPNFKSQSELSVGMTAAFPQVPESGEFQHGSVTEGKITWKLLTYGQIINFTRQALVDDNLGAFTNIPQQMGMKAAMRQSSLAWACMVATNAAVYPGDSGSTNLFAAGHNNLANPATAIAVDSLGLARKALKAQTDLGGDKIEMGDRFFLVVPTTKEQLARQYTSSAYMPTAQSSINPWTGSFEVIASADLDANSTTAWYVLPNPVAIAPVFIYGFLDGNEGVYSETRQGFDVDGTEWKARFDFGVGAVDYRGAYKNAGA